MSVHGYSGLADYCFWRGSIAKPDFRAVDPVVSGKFRVGPQMKVATAGSCFAQHIARHLSQNGFHYFVAETAHPLITPDWAAIYGYGVYSARYGNIYTSRQFVQLLKRAYGLFEPEERAWRDKNGNFIDPFRPRIQPRGFVSALELESDRRQHLAAVRRIVEESDVLVFTLGLTETWASRATGAVYPLCPGVAGGDFDPAIHEFVNLRIGDVIADLEWALEFLRSKNPTCRVIFTVSPVPLAATAENRSVLTSTISSKSILRVAAEEVARERDWVAYFPSYEIIAGHYNRGAYYADDLREVTEAGVSHVMRLFMAHYAEGGAAPAPRGEGRLAAESRAHAEIMRVAAKAICEEEALGDLR